MKERKKSPLKTSVIRLHALIMTYSNRLYQMTFDYFKFTRSQFDFFCIFHCTANKYVDYQVA